MTFLDRATTAVVALPLAVGLGVLPAVSAHGSTRGPDGAGSVDVAAPSEVDGSSGAVSGSDTHVESVLVISVDGLNPAAITRLGRRGAPTLHRLRQEGVSTHNARTSFESTSTLPNHTGMVTGRRVRAAAGGHGVTWNDQRLKPRTVHRSAGEQVDSVFTVAAAAGGQPAVFASKKKFTLFKRTWSRAVDRSVIVEDNAALVRRLVRDLRTQERSLRFLHLSWPDGAGHERGYMSRHYLRAVTKVDAALGRVLATLDKDPLLGERTAVLLTSDHGGARAKVHDNATRPVNYRVPFYAYGPGIPAGVDLYALNPTYSDPGRSRPHYSAADQPVRNIAVGNVALDLLDLPAVPGSTINADQDLVVRP